MGTLLVKTNGRSLERFKEAKTLNLLVLLTLLEEKTVFLGVFFTVFKALIVTTAVTFITLRG